MRCNACIQKSIDPPTFRNVTECLECDKRTDCCDLCSVCQPCAAKLEKEEIANIRFTAEDFNPSFDGQLSSVKAAIIANTKVKPLLNENARLRAALEFYADKKHWFPGGMKLPRIKRWSRRSKINLQSFFRWNCRPCGCWSIGAGKFFMHWECLGHTR